MLQRYLEFVSRTPILWLGFILMNLTTFGIFRNLPDLKELAIDRMQGYSTSDVLEVLSSIGEAGRATYEWANLIDMVFPVFYVSFFAGVLFRFPLKANLWWLALIPIFAGLCDEVENFHIRQMLLSYPVLDQAQVAVSSLFTQAKWWLVSASILLCLVSLTVCMVQWIRGRFST